ncbi:MAG: hypothetical protein GY755_04695, partial [Chloroflexi bacterium]|nr:hypothetical protein [Chloroflexota bacterium]
MAYHNKNFNQKMYLPQIPENMKIITHKFNYKQQHTQMEHNILYIWPDGSIKETINGIKIGGFGVYIEIYKTSDIKTYNNVAVPQTDWFLALGKQYDINYVETKAIHNALLELPKNYKKLLKTNHTIHIITDNENAYNWIAQHQSTNEKYIFQLILKIYRTIIALKQYKLNVIIQCCRRGIWNGNNKADALAKRAVDEYIQYNGFKYGNATTPISTNTIKTHIKSQWKILKYKQTQSIHTNAVISRNMALWQIYDEKQPILWDQKQFQIEEFAILTFLRSEHIRLNWYFHIRNHYKYYKNQIQQYNRIQDNLICNAVCCIDNNNGLCNNCQSPETVYHFLIKCDKYDTLREFYIHPIYQFLSNDLNDISLK